MAYWNHLVHPSICRKQFWLLFDVNFQFVGLMEWIWNDRENFQHKSLSSQWMDRFQIWCVASYMAHVVSNVDCSPISNSCAVGDMHSTTMHETSCFITDILNSSSFYTFRYWFDCYRWGPLCVTVGAWLQISLQIPRTT